MLAPDAAPEVIPAVDLLGGRCVRLLRGDARRVTDYGDPIDRACGYASEGARWLHLVDLDAAFGGPLTGLEVVRRVTGETGLAVQFGGGLRTPELLESAIRAGAGRVITGTAPLQGPDFLRQAVEICGPRLVLALDLRDGQPLVRGWLERAAVGLREALDMAVAAGVKSVLITDTDADGAMSGVRASSCGPALDMGLDVQSAGGVASLDDIRALAALSPRGLRAIVVGSALLRGEFSLREARRVAGISARQACAAAGGM